MIFATPGGSWILSVKRSDGIQLCSRRESPSTKRGSEEYRTRATIFMLVEKLRATCQEKSRKSEAHYEEGAQGCRSISTVLRGQTVPARNSCYTVNPRVICPGAAVSTVGIVDEKLKKKKRNTNVPVYLDPAEKTLLVKWNQRRLVSIEVWWISALARRGQHSDGLKLQISYSVYI